ncbi:hypothetical protein E2C01_091327 [Portunus trituberculatus]|uniref:Uncharacterized protein n=1 Tax=Portunus trituberculatus TaxID=210409 RepID=A0A5B7JMN6_PORTR|nr:hypothetical protein [Portunus trituberculatus]
MGYSDELCQSQHQRNIMIAWGGSGSGIKDCELKCQCKETLHWNVTTKNFTDLSFLHDIAGTPLLYLRVFFF